MVEGEVTTWADVFEPGRASSFFQRDPLPRFEPDSVAWSAANAWWLAELSRLIYRHDVEEGETASRPRSLFLRDAGLRQVEFFDARRTSTQAYLVMGDDARFAVLAFRGTERGVRDLLTDLKLYPRRRHGGGGLVHRGFDQALESVWPGVEAALSRIPCPVFYTGHSLGAALATLAAARRAPAALYTFGSPRVGDRAFIESLRHVPAFRVVDDIDGVTRMPPRILGFEHLGEERRLLAPANRRSSPLGPPKLLADHAPINYVRRNR